MKLIPKQFRVLNFHNIDDSGCIPLDKVTAFVGRNESGKTALLKALHKFNPATEEPYDALREFPRDRYTAEYTDDGNWPVCRVEFELSEDFQTELKDLIPGAAIPHIAKMTRFYNDKLKIEYTPDLPPDYVDPAELTKSLQNLANKARRLRTPPNLEAEEAKSIRASLANWADDKNNLVTKHQDLKSEEGLKLLQQIRRETNDHADPLSADLIEEFITFVDSLILILEAEPISQQIENAVKAALPVFIYFENYGILDSAVYLPRFLEDLSRSPEDPKLRTISAMFKYANLTASEIAGLGKRDTTRAQITNESVSAEMIAQGREQADRRAIELNAASNHISEKFSEWYSQRRHTITYQADGDYFRIWVSDERQPQAKIELESRSKGFQWFFSFYLVFLVESEDGHKDAVLLLDEPGLHLHPTAQQDLITFFENLADKNPLVYTTHSPFLIDGENIQRVRPVTEDETGHSSVSADIWPSDRETIFPLQAAAGYAMVSGLFQHKKNLLVEGIADYLYLHSLNILCRSLERESLPEDIYITPCGGTPHVGHLASLFLGQKVRPVVLLDGDEAGRARGDALMKKLYSGHESTVLLLDWVFGQDDYEIEDIVGEETMLPHLNKIVESNIALNKDDRSKGSVVAQIKSAACRRNILLPIGWKAEVARRIVTDWSTFEPENVPDGILDKAEILFKEINARFVDSDSSAV